MQHCNFAECSQCVRIVFPAPEFGIPCSSESNAVMARQSGNPCMYIYFNTSVLPVRVVGSAEDGRAQGVAREEALWC